MLNRNDLQFLRDVLNKSRVQTFIAPLSDPASSIIDKGFSFVFDAKDVNDITVSEYIGELEPNTLYKRTDSFGLSYIYFLLPETAIVSIMYIGPFISTPITSRQILEIGEKNSISPKNFWMIIFTRFR